MVKRVVSQCKRCQSIDPAVTHLLGEVGAREVEKDWRLTLPGVTVPYLTMVDCGPGRFTRQLNGETVAEICREINSVFFERGTVRELLMDNVCAFLAEEMQRLLDRWGEKA